MMADETAGSSYGLIFPRDGGQIACSDELICLVTTYAAVKCSGYGYHGSRGDGVGDSVRSSGFVDVIPGWDVASGVGAQHVSVGGSFHCVVTTLGGVSFTS
jgi:hypothetical protein